MRTLSEIAVKKPISVARCNDDMETLVADSNRSIATLAITTLLKTGNETSVDRLMKQISTFMIEISDEFKIVVVKAILELCVKYPQKHRVMINFLATFLREEGGYEFKKSIVDSMVEMMTVIPETKETSLLHLCEFIEDCEFSELIVQILHLIGSIGPATSTPSRFIRYIFNRVILENSIVRAAAVSTLGTFASKVTELRSSIISLLKHSLIDEDDEVRDRTALIVASFGALENFSVPNYKQDDYIKDGKYILLEEPLQMSFSAMERSMKAYMEYPNALHDNAKPLTFNSLPVIEEAYIPSLPAIRSGATKKKGATAPTEGSEGAVSTSVDPSSIVYRIPEFANLGRAFHASKEIPLTETEMEYVVTCTKHIFESHVVLQFVILNTIDDQRLKDLKVNVSFSETDTYTIEHVIPAPLVRYGEQANCFVSLNRTGKPASIMMDCEMSFRVVQVDPNTGNNVSRDLCHFVKTLRYR
jgi:coatomer protein complex subunit gamma